MKLVKNSMAPNEWLEAAVRLAIQAGADPTRVRERMAQLAAAIVAEIGNAQAEVCEDGIMAVALSLYEGGRVLSSPRRSRGAILLLDVGARTWVMSADPPNNVEISLFDETDRPVKLDGQDTDGLVRVPLVDMSRTLLELRRTLTG